MFFIPTVIFMIVFTVLLCSCVGMDRVVIDGAEAERIANLVNDSALDESAALRGNSPSNLRSGGYVLESIEDIYYINRMGFDDDSTVAYLQRLSKKALGNDFLENEIISELDGVMAGLHGKTIFYIDHGANGRIAALDLESYATEYLTETPVEALHLLGGTLYYSYLDRPGLYCMVIGSGMEQLLHPSLGPLVSISDKRALAYSRPGKLDALTLVPFTDPQGSRVFSGHEFAQAELSGSWVFFTENGRLWRMSVDGGPVVAATVLEGTEYALGSAMLVVAPPDGGLYAGHIDGTGFRQIAKDAAEDIAVIGSMVYYRNLGDEGNLYVIDTVANVRTIVQGDTKVDGGTQLKALDKEARIPFNAYYGTFLELVREVETSVESYLGRIPGEFLFADYTQGTTEPVLILPSAKQDIGPKQIGSIVTVRQKMVVLGYYTDGGEARRLDTVLTVFAVNDINPLFKVVVQGKPPTFIKHGEGDRLGLPRSWEQGALDLMANYGAKSLF